MFTNLITTSRSHIKFEPPPESSIGEAPANAEPWERMDYSLEKQQDMHYEWGRHCTLRAEMELAEAHFDQALHMKPNDARSLYSRSVCKRSLTKTEAAFEDSLKATYLNRKNPHYSNEYMSTLYELNEFEASLGKSRQFSRLFIGPYKKVFQELSEVLLQNLEDSLGPSLGFFLNEHAKLCHRVLHEYKLKNNVDRRPLWKILKEQGLCDAVSVIEEEELRLHPLEVARRYRALRVFYQKFLPRTWIDYMSLRKLSKNEEAFGDAFQVSTPKLRQVLDENNDAVKRFAKMLHARCPLYADLKNVEKRKKIWKRCQESHLNVIQYQTRRNMFIVLRNIRQLAALNDIEKLAKYVEKAMGDYFIVKTHRIAPWRFEFVNEVYNLLALSYARIYTIPPKFELYKDDACEKLLFLPNPQSDFPPPPEADECLFHINKKEITHDTEKLYLKRLENRLYFAKYPIERAYLYHEMARKHFQISNMDDAAVHARKGFEEAKRNNNLLYAFLCAMMTGRAQAANFKIDESLQQIMKARQLAKELNHEKLIQYTVLADAVIGFKVADRQSRPSIKTIMSTFYVSEHSSHHQTERNSNHDEDKDKKSTRSDSRSN